MNTQISVINSVKHNDKLIILADRDNLGWASDYLTKVEISFLKSMAEQDVTHVFLAKAEGYIIVQFLKPQSSDSHAREEARIAGNEILNTLNHYNTKKVTLLNKSTSNYAREYLEGMVLGNYHFGKYFKTKKDNKHNTLSRINLLKGTILNNTLTQLKAVLGGTLLARDLVNEPQSYLTAKKLSQEIKRAAKDVGLKVTVFDKKKIQNLKMGGILSVNKGSFAPPTFNIIEWKPPKAKNNKPIVLVGKGIVYDTGGLSLKGTPNSMDKMKSDMAGAATVVGTLTAVAQSKLPLHIIGLIPATDNRPGNDAYAPGDVITMYSGATVEVMNTDAEGRLVLADALHYAKRYKPELVLDFATLTGTAAYSVGKEAICYMGKTDKNVKEKIELSGHNVYERLIEFPLWKEYGEQLKSNIADLKNLGGPSAGMITAGKFLEYFTDYPWLHFDIAGSAFLKSADAYRPKDGTGVGVRLLFDFLKNY